MRLPLRYYGDPILRKKCERINKIDDKIHQIVANMVETMFAEDGCGLAAPQIGLSISLFLVVFPHYDAEGKLQWLPQKTKTYLNPKIISFSSELVEEDEACLSLPGLVGGVIRPKEITIEAMNLHGEIFQESYSGYDARQVFHENDHLNGVLFIDRMDAKERKALDPVLQKIKKRFNAKK